MVKLLCMVVFALAIAAAAAFAEEPVTNAMPDPVASPAPSGSGTTQPGQVLGGLRAPVAQPAPETVPGGTALRRDDQGRGGAVSDQGGPRRRMNADRRERLRERMARLTPEQRAALIERLRERRAQRHAGLPQ